MVALESGPVMTTRLCLHLDPDPVRPRDADCPGTHSISCKDIKKAFPVQGIICLVQVEEYGTEDRLPHGDDVLE